MLFGVAVLKKSRGRGVTERELFPLVPPNSLNIDRESLSFPGVGVADVSILTNLPRSELDERDDDR